MIEMTYRRVTLHPTHPFTISRESSDIKTNILVTLRWEGLEGIGEAAPHSFFGETPETVERELDRGAPLLDSDPSRLDETLAGLRTEGKVTGAALAAIDMALHDIAAKSLSLPLYQFLGLSPDEERYTSFTIGLDTPQKMVSKLKEAGNFPVYKIKLGGDEDLEIIQALRSETDASLRVDPNAGWTVEEAVEKGQKLSEYSIEHLEQPIPPLNSKELGLVRDGQPLPVFADESCRVAADIPDIAPYVDGINIKLMKCGGIQEALRMIKVARECGLGIMLGCMIESSVGITAAAHLMSLVDFLDLDGNLLIDNDPYIGVTHQNGKLQLPSAPGLGVTPVEGATIQLND